MFRKSFTSHPPIACQKTIKNKPEETSPPATLIPRLFIPHSIRWRMQIWHGLLLLVVLAGFGITAYRLEWASEMQRVDSELQQQVSGLLGMMHDARSGRPGRPPPPPKRLGPEDLFSPLSMFDDRPPPRMPDELQPELEEWLTDLAATSPYMVVWAPPGHPVLVRGELAQNLERPLDFDMTMPLVPRGRTLTLDHSPWVVREVMARAPSDECMVVGRGVLPEQARLRSLAWQLTALGGGVWMIAFLVGGWITGRALKPIQQITKTASRISAGSLDQRIDTAGTDTELGQMATVLNQTFGRLQDSFEKQAQFSADAAHELRTPVSVVLSETQFALSREREAGDYRQSLEACQRAARRMHQLTESLLELSRLDAGVESLQVLPLDLANVVQENMQLLFPIAEARGITLDGNLDPAPCLGDAGKLSQVLANLMSNALQHSPDGSTLHLSSGVTDGLAFASVRDEGKGIAQEHLARLFDRFYRADTSRHRATGGAGLGLAICKAIMDAHHGTLEVSSEIGVGSTFTFKLKATDE